MIHCVDWLCLGGSVMTPILKNDIGMNRDNKAERLWTEGDWIGGIHLQWRFKEW